MRESHQFSGNRGGCCVGPASPADSICSRQENNPLLSSSWLLGSLLSQGGFVCSVGVVPGRGLPGSYSASCLFHSAYLNCPSSSFFFFWGGGRVETGGKRAEMLFGVWEWGAGEGRGSGCPSCSLAWAVGDSFSLQNTH